MLKPYLNTIVCLLLIILLPDPVWAQEYFVEGKITFNVYLKNVNGQSESANPSGTYTIIIKGALIRKEISLDNGFKRIFIYDRNTNSEIALRPDKQYAIQLNPEEIQEKHKQFEGFKLTDEKKTETIAGLTANKATVTYKDGSISTIYYTNHWALKEAEIFDRLPGITYLPLAFEYKNEEGITMSFRATNIEARPMESSLFKIPKEYKVISYKEYRQLKK